MLYFLSQERDIVATLPRQGFGRSFGWLGSHHLILRLLVTLIGFFMDSRQGIGYVNGKYLHSYHALLKVFALTTYFIVDFILILKVNELYYSQ